MADEKFVWVITIGNTTPPLITKYPLVSRTAKRVSVRINGSRIETFQLTRWKLWRFSEAEAVTVCKDYCSQEIKRLERQLASFVKRYQEPLVVEADQNPIPKSGELDLDP